jgi:2-oxoglutarate ferredoxin oxidoreductase subunit gamma
MKNIQIKIGGFGGQGIVLAGYILGKAASIHDKKNATLTQSYGPESRGSSCSAQLIIGNEEIDYPRVSHPDILMIMSQEAYDKFTPELTRGGTLLYDEDLAKPTNNFGKTTKVHSIPATRYAEELGKKVVANIIMLGFFTAISGLISPEAMKKSIRSSTPIGFEDLNIKAFDRGYDSGVANTNKTT